jgi:hypothetical protein
MLTKRLTQRSKWDKNAWIELVNGTVKRAAA